MQEIKKIEHLEHIEFDCGNGNRYIGNFDVKEYGKGTLYNEDGDVICEVYLLPDGSLYEGNIENGKKHGKGKLYKHGKVIFDGEYKDDKRHYGECYFLNGNRYKGSFGNDKEYGKGTLYDKNRKVTYEVYCLQDGSLYKGAFKNDKMHGQGTLYNEDGELIFDGYFKNGKKHGEGKLCHIDGGWYEGGWENGKKHGKGTYHWPDGSRCEGEFKNDERHGQGKLYNKNGRVIFDGYFENGKKHGQGTLYNEDGELIFDGYFKNGKKHGKGIYKDDKSLKKGYWKNDHFCTGEEHVYKDKTVYIYRGFDDNNGSLVYRTMNIRQMTKEEFEQKNKTLEELSEFYKQLKEEQIYRSLYEINQGV